jgi:hypothetical protein
MQAWQLFGLIISKIKRITEKLFRICSVSFISTKFVLYIFRCNKYFYPDKHVGIIFVDNVIYEWKLERLDFYV